MPPSAPSPLSIAPLQAPSLRRRMACWLYESLLLFGVVFVAVTASYAHSLVHNDAEVEHSHETTTTTPAHDHDAIEEHRHDEATQPASETTQDHEHSH